MNMAYDDNHDGIYFWKVEKPVEPVDNLVDELVRVFRVHEGGAKA